MIIECFFAHMELAVISCCCN